MKHPRGGPARIGGPRTRGHGVIPAVAPSAARSAVSEVRRRRSFTRPLVSSKSRRDRSADRSSEAARRPSAMNDPFDARMRGRLTVEKTATDRPTHTHTHTTGPGSGPERWNGSRCEADRWTRSHSLKRPTGPRWTLFAVNRSLASNLNQGPTKRRTDCGASGTEQVPVRNSARMFSTPLHAWNAEFAAAAVVLFRGYWL